MRAWGSFDKCMYYDDKHQKLKQKIFLRHEAFQHEYLEPMLSDTKDCFPVLCTSTLEKHKSRRKIQQRSYKSKRKQCWYVHAKRSNKSIFLKKLLRRWRAHTRYPRNRNRVCYLNKVPLKSHFVRLSFKLPFHFHSKSRSKHSDRSQAAKRWHVTKKKAMGK